MKNQQNGFGKVAIIIVVVLILVMVVFLLRQKDGMPGYNTGNQQVSQNTNDLDTLSADLDNTNPDQLDAELGQLDSDSSTF